MQTTTNNILRVKLSDSKFGIDAENVKEIIPYQKITPIPMQSELFSGVVLHRGRSIPVFNLQKKLQLSLPLNGDGYIVILSLPDEDKALWVNDVDGIGLVELSEGSKIANTPHGLINIIDQAALH
jgi:two-component system chemotaxis response regulator CheV